jgi:ubiquinone/menaquinone biosynthesis C-methylase UbiE
MIKSALKILLPHAAQRTVRKHLEGRKRSRIFGDLARYVPPVELMFDGLASVEDFKAQGDEYLKIFRDVVGLKPDENILDVGCGIGRKTLPLTQYLNERGRYEGIDITKPGIDWCSEKITPDYPNFTFQYIDVFNQLYNPQGRIQPHEYRFPFEDESFDFITLGSVFTHMLPPELKNYLAQIERVLKKGGRCLITYFLLNDESLKLIEESRSTIDFKFAFEEYRVASQETPEGAVAYHESWIKEAYRKAPLEIQRVDYGSWCGRGRYLSYQDIVLAVKEQSPL